MRNATCCLAKGKVRLGIGCSGRRRLILSVAKRYWRSVVNVRASMALPRQRATCPHITSHSPRRTPPVASEARMVARPRARRSQLGRYPGQYSGARCTPVERRRWTLGVNDSPIKKRCRVCEVRAVVRGTSRQVNGPQVRCARRYLKKCHMECEGRGGAGACSGSGSVVYAAVNAPRARPQ